ncbi:MAG: hypothetical protein H0U73_00450 [Tatlockia sp.]|nr:hypothetical protein [Tatlockia sp.]
MRYKEELIQLILDNEKLGSILNQASEILNIINQSDSVDLIKLELKNPENYAILKQSADISNYFDVLGNLGVIDFTKYVLRKMDLSEKLSSLETQFLTIHLMNHFFHNNKDLYEVLSLKKSNENCSTFDVVYEPKIYQKIDQVRYQFLFDLQNNSWKLHRFAPGNSEPEIITDDYVKRDMSIVLANIQPETLNPFLKKKLYSSLEIYENRYFQNQQKTLIKEVFKNKAQELIPLIKQFVEEISLNSNLINKIHCIQDTYFKNAISKPELMSKLLLEKDIFTLKNDFSLISELSEHVEWTRIEELLQKEWIKLSLLDAQWGDLYTLERAEKDLSSLSQFFFKNVSKEKLKKLDVNCLKKWVLALSEDDLVKYMNEGKIELEYPPSYSDFIEELYKAYHRQFPTILEKMISSGKIIHDIPRDKKIQQCFVNLFLKHDGQWLNLIYQEKRKRNSLSFNHKADLLSLALGIYPEKTLAIIKAHSLQDSKGESYFHMDLNAEEITNLIKQAPEHACVLLDYKNIIETLKQDTISYKPYGKLRRFDLLFSILRGIPENYTEKLLRSGILFPEKGMPHFQHLSGLGAFGGRNASGCINNILERVYQVLPCSTFMSALSEGLVHQNVNHLFLKEVFEINLMELAKVLSQFQNIKYLDLALSLKEENQNNIIEFFKILRETNPDLNYHIQVKITHDTEELVFLTNYLSQSDDQIISLTFSVEDFWIRAKLLDKDDPSFKNFFDKAIEEICENNFILRQISINGFSESIFSRNESAGYCFSNFPSYNTSLFSINSTDALSSLKEDSDTKIDLKRNRALQALKVLSNEINHFQNILELLPWFELSGLSAEIIVKIFEELKYQHRLSTATPPYQKILESIQKLKLEPSENNNDSFAELEHGINKAKNFLKVSSMAAYHRYKPHKEDIHTLRQYLQMDKIHERVVKAISDWFSDERPNLPLMLDQFKVVNKIIANLSSTDFPRINTVRSDLPFIYEMDGIPLKNDKASEHICEIRNTLHHYQKAISRCAKSLRRDAYFEFQCKGPLKNSLHWKDYSAQSFDGVEFLAVLMNDAIFSKFSEKESCLFNQITEELKLYLLQKEKSKEKQCDKHKHLHKNELFNLLRPESTVIFNDSNPRLYQIFQLQRERLANSITKCSVKLLLSYSGLYSSQHEKKKLWDEEIVSKYKKEIKKKCITVPEVEKEYNDSSTQRDSADSAECCMM